MEPRIAEEDFRLYVGEALSVLATLPSGSVDCVITSPPYFGLRDYGTGDSQLGLEPVHDCAGWATGNRCEACYVCKLVAVLAECRRVLAPHGTLWLNLGDSYASSGGHTGQGATSQRDGRSNVASQNRGSYSNIGNGLKAKDLVGIPWRVALALQADGWWLRNDNIWSKGNPMPSSVTDRATVSHEYVFMLARSPRYWYDAEAVAEPSANAGAVVTLGPASFAARQADGMGRERSGNALAAEYVVPESRNARTVWPINTAPYPGAHFAVFPQALARRALVAGCPREVCTVCGTPRSRIVERGAPILQADTWSANGAASYDDETGGYVGSGDASTLKHIVPTRTIGWTDCGHAAWRTGVVLDPFLGSGTVAVVARQENRHAVGIELNPAYVPLIEERLAAWRTGRPAPAPAVDPDQLTLAVE